MADRSITDRRTWFIIVRANQLLGSKIWRPPPNYYYSVDLLFLFPPRFLATQPCSKWRLPRELSGKTPSLNSKAFFRVLFSIDVLSHHVPTDAGERATCFLIASCDRNIIITRQRAYGVRNVWCSCVLKKGSMEFPIIPRYDLNKHSPRGVGETVHNHIFH